MLKILKKFLGIENPNIPALLNDGAVIIDVRTLQEFESGHGKGAVNIPLQQIDHQLQKIKKYQKPVITCCKSGMRSATAASKLKAVGIEAYNGGSWTSVDKILKS